MPNNIGEAYIQIKPSMEGVSGEIEKALGDAGESGSSAFGSKFAGGLKTVGKVAGAALTAAGTAVSAITKSAVSSFSDFQQLTGGIETLFGTGGKSYEDFANGVRVTTRDLENSGIDWDKYLDTAWMTQGGINGMIEEMQYNLDEIGTSAEDLAEYLHFDYDLDMDDAILAVQTYQDTLTDENIQNRYQSMMKANELVMKNAAEAYKTAGLSANDYMDLAIQSAAAMVNSLGGDTEKAAALMDVSIIDMADNVNKMGTSMEAVQNAYRGFSRGNFTMLDNLALGFAGTKKGMQELLDSAKAISGVKYDIDSYSDIVQAIHVVQVEMGIAETTANEASGTISGSVGAVKAAWENLMTGIANPNADLGVLIQQVIDSALVSLDNLLPTIEQTLIGIADALVVLVPAISERLPGLLEAILPALIEAAIGLLNGLVEALPTILTILIQQLPMIIQTIVDTVITLLPMILDLGLQLIMALADGLIQNLPTLIPAVVGVIMTMVEKLTEPDTLVQLLDAALQIIMALAEGLLQALPELLGEVPYILLNLVEAIIKAAPLLLQAALELVLTLAAGIVESLAKLNEKGKEMIDAVKDGFWEKIESAKTWGKDMIQNFIDGIMAKWKDLKNAVKDLANSIKSLLGFSEPEEGPLSNFHTYAPDMLKLFADGIRENVGLVTSAVDDMANGISGEMAVNANVTGRTSSGLASYEIASPQMAMAGAAAGGDVVIPVYIGNERIDEIVVKANQRANYRSGGR